MAEESKKISLKGVAEASEKQWTKPGTIDLFKIVKVEFGASQNKGTYFMGVDFARKEDSFGHRFFLTEKALPRIQTLVSAALGKKTEEEFSEDELIKILTGKVLAVKTTARFDETNGKAFVDLPWGGFAKPAAELEAMKKAGYSEDQQRDITKALAIIASGSLAKAEKPGADAADEISTGSSGNATADSAAAPANDDPFA